MQAHPAPQEDGIDIPYDQIKPVTLRNMIEEFVTREWSDLSDSGFTLEQKVEQLKDRKAKIVFDFTAGR